MKRIIIILLGSLFCLSFIQTKDKRKPNIIIINVDDLGWRDVGYMGSRYYETPNIDDLSKQGMTFTDGYASAANCMPSRASLMTGEWNTRHGIYTVGTSERGKSQTRRLIPVENMMTLAMDRVVFSALLRENGYRTCIAGKWHLSEDPRDYGFDVNIGGGSPGNPGSYYPPYGIVNLEAKGREYLTDVITEKTIQFIDSVTQPFLLYYAPYAVHTPIQAVDGLKSKYTNKPAWNGQNNVDYATMIENLDNNIGLLISALKRKNIFNESLIVFTSDNGGLLGITNQHPLRSGKGSYYEGGIRVPFFFVWKGKIRANSTSNIPITNLDIFPTILESAGIELNTLKYDGQSLLPLLIKGKKLADRPLFWHFPIYIEANKYINNENRDSLFRTRPGSVVRFGDWKLHHYYENDDIELYNLHDDPGEKRDISKNSPQKAQELLKILNKWIKETNAPIPREINMKYH